MKKGETAFLSNWKPSVYDYGYGSKALVCEGRGKSVIAKPEELVRQRILRWLIHDKSWLKEHIDVEPTLQYTDGNYGRPDILLLNRLGKVSLVIECKREEHQIDEADLKQAKRYANKCRSENILVTNGIQYFFEQKVDGRWRHSDYSKLLKIAGTPPSSAIVLPEEHNVKDVREYWKWFGKLYDQKFSDLAGKGGSDLSKFSLAIHKIIFDMKPNLPYSHGGVHILEDRGTRFLNIPTPGGGWYGLYRLFLTATEGRVETAAVGLQRWSDDSVRICVGFIKEKRSHHALQLDSSKCERKGEKWIVWHHGIMGGRSIPRIKVIESIVESGQTHLIGPGGGAKYVCLGTLHTFPTATWRNSREFLANLLHYGILRTNLREAYPYGST